MIIPFDGVDDGKVHLLYTSLFVLEYFRTFVFEPMLDMPVPMEGDAGHIGFPLFRHPMDAVFGTLVESDTPQPVIHDQVVLQGIPPDDRVLELSFDRRINPLVRDLFVRGDAVFADPDASSPANHQIRTILPFGKAEVAQSFDDLPVAGIERKLSVLPGAVDLVGYIISVDDIYDDPAVVEDESLRVMPFPDCVLDGERPMQMIAGCMING